MSRVSSAEPFVVRERRPNTPPAPVVLSRQSSGTCDITRRGVACPIWLRHAGAGEDYWRGYWVGACSHANGEAEQSFIPHGNLDTVCRRLSMLQCWICRGHGRSNFEPVVFLSQSVRSVFARGVLIVEKSARNPGAVQLHEGARTHSQMRGHFGGGRRTLLSEQCQKSPLTGLEVSE